MAVDALVPSHDNITEARTIIDRAQDLIEDVDDNMVENIKTIKNKILNEMRFYSHNLFTFAKAWPLVEKDPTTGEVRSIGEFPTSRFDFAPKIMDEFYDTGLDLQIKFDFLNEDLLKNVIDSGSRVLHLSSDIFEKDCLFIEDRTGICKKIFIQDIERYFSTFKYGAQFKGKRLPVDCVVLAIPDSTEIGKIFARLGV